MRITGNDLPEVLPENSGPSYQEIGVTPDAFGAGVSRAIGRMGEGLQETATQRFHTEMVKQGLYNETVAKEADVQASSKLADLQYNPEHGYMVKKGRNAVAAYADTLKAAEQIRKDTLESLPNDRTRKMFDQVFLRRLQYAQEGIGSHASRENLAWMKDTSKAREESIVSEGTLNWNNLDRFNKVTIPGVVSEVKARSEMNGDDETTTNLEVQKAIDAAHVSRLKAMVNYDPAGAVRQIDQIAPNLSAAGRVQAEEVVMHGVRLVHEEQMWTEHAIAKARQEKDESISQGFFTQFTNHQLTPQAIDKSELSAPMKAHWYSVVSQQSRQDDKLENNNPTVIADTLSRIHLPYGNQNKITDINDIYSLVGRGISLSAAGTLVKMVIDQRTPEGQRLAEVRNRAFTNLRPQFVHDTATGPDLIGGKDFFEFQQAVVAKEDELRQKKEDPNQIYNPKSKEYIGNMVDLYKATFRQRLQRQIDAIKAPGPTVEGSISKGVPVEPRKEGESVKDYLKRTSGG